MYDTICLNILTKTKTHFHCRDMSVKPSGSLEYDRNAFGIQEEALYVWIKFLKMKRNTYQHEDSGSREETRKGHSS